MFRKTTLLLVALVVSLPAAAEETAAPDCSMWTIKGVGPGMTLAEATKDREFNEYMKYRDEVGYRRYVWQAEDRLEKIELHVDVKADASRIIGVTTTYPIEGFNAAEFKRDLVSRWGPPTEVSKQGAFNLYTWINEPCDVAVRASVMNQHHDVAVFLSMAKLSARDELARRRREMHQSEAEEKK